MPTRDALEAAFDQLSEDSNSAGTPDTNDVESQQVSAQADSGEGESQAQSLEQTVQDVLEAPEVWKPEYREKFKSLDKDWQQYLLNLNKDQDSHFTKRTQELSELQRRYKGLDEVFEPYQQKFLQSGIQPHDVARRLLQWNEAFERDPLTATNALLETLGVTPEQFIAWRQAQQSAPDSALSPIYKELEESRRFREQLQKEREELEAKKQLESIQSDLQKMAEEKDASGNPKRPHFMHLRGAIQGLIPQIVQEEQWSEKSHREIAEEAYRRAFEPLKELLKQQAIGEAKKTQKAIKAGSPIGQRAVLTNGTRAPKSVREALEDAWDKHS